MQKVFLARMNLRGNMRPKAYPDLSELFGLSHRGLYWDNGKENGNYLRLGYLLGFYRGLEVLAWLSFEPHKSCSLNS